MMDAVKKAKLPNMIKKAKRQEQAMMENEAEPRASPAWSRRPKLIKEAELMDVIKKAEKQELVKSKKDELMDVMEGAQGRDQEGQEGQDSGRARADQEGGGQEAGGDGETPASQKKATATLPEHGQADFR